MSKLPDLNHEEIRGALAPEDKAWLEYACQRSGLPVTAWTASPHLLRLAWTWVTKDMAARLDGRLVDDTGTSTRRYTWKSAADEAEAYFLANPPQGRTKNVRRLLAAWWRRVTE